MKTQYQYITFVERPPRPKTSVWSCRNNHNLTLELGEIRWYSPWRQYCYFPTGETVYSAGCLKDIEDFIAQLKRLQKARAELEKEDD